MRKGQDPKQWRIRERQETLSEQHQVRRTEERVQTDLDAEVQRAPSVANGRAGQKAALRTPGLDAGSGTHAT